ncbi:MAG: hypothetical protein FJW20_24410 [Acidimicrobiia bacterium]|nr:hypothetical protein [Acidimicrobiia bacterium]
MAFALWVDAETAWAEGTHEYRPMGAAVIASTDLFQPRDFRPRRRRRSRRDAAFQGLFASLEEVNQFLRDSRPHKKGSQSALARQLAVT